MSQQSYDKIIPEEIYYNYLSEIEGVKFTPREIDIIACVLHGKSVKTIAQFFTCSEKSLHIKSVESHISNIRRKISGASKDSIINFLEKSDKYKFVLRYYQALLLQKEFKKTINEIKELTKNSNFKFQLEDNRDIDSPDYLKFTKNHLISYLDKLSNLKKTTDFTISLVPSSYKSKTAKNSKNLLYLIDNFVDIAGDNESLSEATPDRIFIKSHKNFYFFFLEMLNLVFSKNKAVDINLLKEISNRFKDRFESIYETLRNNSTVSKNEQSDFKIKLSDTIIRLQKNQYYIVLVILMFGIISSIYLQQFYKKQIKSEVMSNQKTVDGKINFNTPWNTPYLPNHFVKRSDLRGKIITNFSNDKSTKDNKVLNKAILVGIHGLGGVGRHTLH